MTVTVTVTVTVAVTVTVMRCNSNGSHVTPTLTWNQIAKPNHPNRLTKPLYRR